MHTNNHTGERELLMKLRDGDHTAFEILYNRYSARIYANILKLVKSEDTALDLVQDLFLKIWSSRATIDADKLFSAFLFSITQNLVRDFFRKAVRSQEMQQQLIHRATEFYDHIDGLIQQKEISAVLEQAIGNLPGQQQKIFILCKVEGKSYEEAASILHLSVATIGNQLVKATKTVKTFLSDHDASLMIALFILSRLYN